MQPKLVLYQNIEFHLIFQLTSHTIGEKPLPWKCHRELSGAFSELDLHVIGFRRLGRPVNRSVVRLSCIFRPDELEPPQQSHQEEEELHTSQTLTETHTRTCHLKKEKKHQGELLQSYFPTSVRMWAPCPIPCPVSVHI